MTTVSYSEVSSYLKCRRAWRYGYLKNLERNQTSESLAIGKALHVALESYYKWFIDRKWTAKWHIVAVKDAMARWEENRPETDNKRQDLTESLRLYFHDEPYVSKGYTVLGVEAEYTLLFDSERDLHYPFVVDLLMRDPFGELMVVDHKTGYEFIADGTTEHLQSQLALYIGALRALGQPVVYGEYNQFRTRKIKEPTKEQLLRQSPQRESMTDTRIKATFLEHAETSTEIADVKQDWRDGREVRTPRVANKMVCNSCSFIDLCTAELLGWNANLVEQTQYHIKERRVFAVQTEDA